jgi:RsiW-degrading membrane proteinase PrsW (M82 family)
MTLMIYLVGCLIGLAISATLIFYSYKEFDEVTLGLLVVAVLLTATSWVGFFMALIFVVIDNWFQPVIKKKKKQSDNGTVGAEGKTD